MSLLERIVFYAPPDTLAPLPEVVPELNLPQEYERYRLLADDGGTYFCIDTEHAGAVFWVDPYQELMLRFVNSSTD